MKKVLSLVCVLLLCAALIPAAVAEEAAYTETVVSIPNGDHDIPATVCVPNGEGKFPAVVMLHGTGSNRDEAGNGYKMAAPVLAESMASRPFGSTSWAAVILPPTTPVTPSKAL